MSKNRLIAALSTLSLAVGATIVGSVTVPTLTLALPGASEATVVTVNPTRILDTRLDVGLTGRFSASGSRKLQVTGEIATYVEATDTRENRTVVPAGATGVLLNVTAFVPSAGGFVSLRPGDATGNPSTASLNFEPGQIVPNAVTVQVPTAGAEAGQIDIAYRATTPTATMDVIIDVVGYTTAGGLVDLSTRLQALEALGPGDAGPKGEQGDTGPQGPPGVDPARVVWVAESGGDHTSLSAAMAATTGPAVIKIAPGTYVETAPITIKDNVDIEGSGRDVTTVRCTCGGSTGPEVESADGATLYKPTGADSTISQLTIENRADSSTTTNYGVKLFGQQRLRDIVVNINSNDGYGIVASGDGGVDSSIDGVYIDIGPRDVFSTVNAHGIYNVDSETPISNSTIDISSGLNLIGYGVRNVDSDVRLSRLDIQVGGTTNITAYGVHSIDSDIVIESSNIRASANSANERVVAVFTTRTSGNPSSTIIDSVLIGKATSGAEYGVYSTGSAAFAMIQGSDIEGQTFSVRGRAYLESSTVRDALDSSSQQCFNVRLDSGPLMPSFTTLDASCN